MRQMNRANEPLIFVKNPHETPTGPTQAAKRSLPPEALPLGELGVAPVRILAAGQGRILGEPPASRLLVVRLLANHAPTGNPIRLDLAFTLADCTRLARAAYRVVRNTNHSAFPRQIFGTTEKSPPSSQEATGADLSSKRDL